MVEQPQTATQEYRGPQDPDPPPGRSPSPAEWARENLFSTWYNSLLTVILAPLLATVVFRSLRFVLVTARWEIVQRNLTNFMVGAFPRTELWRPWAALLILGVLGGMVAGAGTRAAQLSVEAKGMSTARPWHEPLRRAGPVLVLVLVIIAFVRTATPVVLLSLVLTVTCVGFLVGKRLPPHRRRWVNVAALLGLVAAYGVIVWFGGVPWGNWGGLMLTMFFAVGGIVLSFPLGVLVALGRRSSLPAVRAVSIAYVEFFRGVPLLALLFVAWLMLGFFLPPQIATPDRVTRALIAFVLFTAAYIAEIVRGGLQSVPRGQYEAAMAIGLSPWTATLRVILPQALRNVIPALVGQFISLFKDTTLVFVIALFEVLRVAQTVTQQEDFLGQGLQTETLTFVAFIFWVGCYWMSRESQRLERRLGLGER